MVGVDQLVGERRNLGEDSQPAERIDALVRADGIGRHALPADAVEAVTAGDEVAVDVVGNAAAGERHARPVRVDAFDRDLLRLVEHRATRGSARIAQIARDLRLAIDGHRMAAQRLQVEALDPAAEGELHAVVDQALAVQARADAGGVEQLHGAALEQPGTDPRLDVVAGPALEHDGVDAMAVQQLREQQARGARADDGDLRLEHDSSACAATTRRRAGLRTVSLRPLRGTAMDGRLRNLYFSNHGSRPVTQSSEFRRQGGTGLLPVRRTVARARRAHGARRDDRRPQPAARLEDPAAPPSRPAPGADDLAGAASTPRWTIGARRSADRRS